MKIMRENSDEYFANLTQEEIITLLDELNISFNSSDDQQQKLKTLAELDTSALYYTSKEMKDFTGIDIDVPAVEQKPEVHIIGRSSSSRSVTLYRYTKGVSTADEEYTDNHSWS